MRQHWAYLAAYAPSNTAKTLLGLKSLRKLKHPNIIKLKEVHLFDPGSSYKKLTFNGI